MDRSRLEILPKVWLDHRRAIYLEEHSALAVADLHLGYAWAHRYHGQMLPLGPGDRLLERLSDLCAYYKPRQFIVLGDIVHQAVPVTAILDDLRALISGLAQTCEPKLILGNHDRKLRSLVRDEKIEFFSSIQLGRYLLLHGNESPPRRINDLILMGHEHPAIHLGDGIKGAKFPCFLLGDSVLILPAFSLWAAGADFRSYPFMSQIARSVRFQKAVAICGEKLLPLSLNP